MTDRELLELAAKAAGIELEWDGPPDMWQPMYYKGKTYHLFDPLNDDGDALRLAVKLSLFIQINSNTATAWKWRGENWYEHKSDYAGDMNSATRRAIVRAAAEIGRSMK